MKQVEKAKPGQKNKKAVAKTKPETAAQKRKKAASKPKVETASSQKETVKVPLTNGAETLKKKSKNTTKPETILPDKEPAQNIAEDTEAKSEKVQTEEGPSSRRTRKPAKRTAAESVAVVPPVKRTRKVPDPSIVPKTRAGIRQKVTIDVPALPSQSGVLFVVGTNDCGQLGLGGDIEEQETPVEFKSKFRYVYVAAGGMHSVCLTQNGEVYTFGCNDEAALGRVTEGKEGAEMVPDKVEVPGVVVKVSAGDSHSAALTDDGRVFVWGNFRGRDGALGLCEPGVKSYKPTQVMHGIKVSNIASGNDHMVCLSSDGLAYTFGCGDSGQLGRVSERSAGGDGRSGLLNLLTPKSVVIKIGKIPLKVEDIWCGGYATFFKTSVSGAIYACGLNNRRQLGIPGSEGEDNIFFPKCVENLSSDLDWKQISCGQHHTLALDKNGKVYSFGNKIYGRLGLGPVPMDENAEKPVVTPTMIPALKNEECVAIAAGNVSSFAVSNKGDAYSWGMGTGFNLGHGNEDDVTTPKVLSSVCDSWNVFKVAGGAQHTLLLANKKTKT